MNPAHLLPEDSLAHQLWLPLSKAAVSMANPVLIVFLLCQKMMGFAASPGMACPGAQEEFSLLVHTCQLLCIQSEERPGCTVPENLG